MINQNKSDVFVVSHYKSEIFIPQLFYMSNDTFLYLSNKSKNNGRLWFSCESNYENKRLLEEGKINIRSVLMLSDNITRIEMDENTNITEEKINKDDYFKKLKEVEMPSNSFWIKDGRIVIK